MAKIELLQGTLDMLVLKALLFGPRHGYGVTEWIHQVSREELEVDDGALYGALHRLAARGLLSTEWGLSEKNRKAKYYDLTAEGRRQLRTQAATWQRYTRAVDRVLGTA